MELNREQIIKALECCQKRKCQSCTYDVFGNSLSNCRVKKHALTLIKELTEERTDHITQLVAQDVQISNLKDEIARLRDKLERTDRALSVMDKAHKELFTESFKIKADTVRKMQERLKEAFEHRGLFGYDIIDKKIDQIAEEMLEGV